jgi:hypothetical protein
MRNYPWEFGIESGDYKESGRDRKGRRARRMDGAKQNRYASPSQESIQISGARSSAG